MSKMFIEIESQDQLNQIIENNKGILIVDFTSPTCPPCLMLLPILEEIVEKELASVASVNVKELIDIAQQNNISATPTLMIYKDNQLKKVELGYKPLESWIDLIEKI